MSIIDHFKSLLSPKITLPTEENFNLKNVYSLEKALESDPKRVELTQRLTLDSNRPLMGMKGAYGLFASEKWWHNFHKNKIPKTVYNGVIEDIHSSGMHNESRSFTLKLDNGGIYKYSLVADRKSDLQLYKKGVRLQIITYIEKMKNGNEQDFVYKISIENT